MAGSRPPLWEVGCVIADTSSRTVMTLTHRGKGLKEQFTQKLLFFFSLFPPPPLPHHNFLLMTLSLEAPLTFPNPHNRFWSSAAARNSNQRHYNGSQLWPSSEMFFLFFKKRKSTKQKNKQKNKTCLRSTICLKKANVNATLLTKLSLVAPGC